MLEIFAKFVSSPQICEIKCLQKSFCAHVLISKNIFPRNKSNFPIREYFNFYLILNQSPFNLRFKAYIMLLCSRFLYWYVLLVLQWKKNLFKNLLNSRKEILVKWFDLADLQNKFLQNQAKYKNFQMRQFAKISWRENFWH